MPLLDFRMIDAYVAVHLGSKVIRTYSANLSNVNPQQFVELITIEQIV